MLEKKGRGAVTISVPSAVQVLETLAGDCNEHTVLYVALARALGNHGGPSPIWRGPDQGGGAAGQRRRWRRK